MAERKFANEVLDVPVQPANRPTLDSVPACSSNRRARVRTRSAAGKQGSESRAARDSAATENTLPKRIRGSSTDHRRRVISAAATRVACKSKGAIDLNRQREQREASNCGEPRDPFHGIESEQPAVLPNIRRHDFPLPKGRGDISRFAFRTGGNSHVYEWISDRCGEPASVSLPARLAATGQSELPTRCLTFAPVQPPFRR